MDTNKPIFNKRELNTGVISLYWFNPLLVLPLYSEPVEHMTLNRFVMNPYMLVLI